MNHIDLFKQRMNDDRALHCGQSVIVYWGYGLGFRARARGKITKLYAKSCRVRIDQDVKHQGVLSWKKGFELKGIPRFKNPNWIPYANCVKPILTPQQPALTRL